jgi:hypothetical protein
MIFSVLFLVLFITACNVTPSSSTDITTASSTTQSSSTSSSTTSTNTQSTTDTQPITTTYTDTNLTTVTTTTDTNLTTITTVTGETTTTNTDTGTTTEVTHVYNTYVFEAEYTYLDELIGYGYSGGTIGTGLIVTDTVSAGASNGYYVSYLYGYGLALTFEIESDRAVDDAVLTLRLSAEVMDIILTSDTYDVVINDIAIGYDDIEFNNVPLMPEILPFQDFVIANISLVAGTNIIELITSNTDAMQGTMYATAPIVDCIKIYTYAALTWDPYTGNIT